MIYRLFDLTYTVPYIRVVPYLAGMLIGYWGYKLKQQPIKMKVIPTQVAWILLIGYLLTPILVSTDFETFSPLFCSLGYSLGKFIFGLCVGGVIILNVFAPEGLVRRVLSHNWFVHLNKLCYGMYLVHPVVIFLLFGLRSQPTYLSESLLVSGIE